MKRKYLYHGSEIAIKGNLIPKKAFDLDKTQDNIMKGIYASSHKEQAIAMGILKCKVVKGSSVHIGRNNGIINMDAVIYGGFPKQKYIYLYTLSSKTFENKPKGSPQWVSPESVKPEKVEELLVKDYIHLIRKATKKEKEKWMNEYGDKRK